MTETKELGPIKTTEIVLGTVSHTGGALWLCRGPPPLLRRTRIALLDRTHQLPPETTQGSDKGRRTPLGSVVAETDSGKLRRSCITPKTKVQAEANGAADNHNNNQAKTNAHLDYDPTAKSRNQAPAQGRVTYTQKSPREWLGHQTPSCAHEGKGRPRSNRT